MLLPVIESKKSGGIFCAADIFQHRMENNRRVSYSVKTKKIIITFLLIAAAVSLLSGCFGIGGSGGSEEEMQSGDIVSPDSAAEKLQIVCTVFPQYDFVRQIAGDYADVSMLIRPGADVHHYEPAPQDIIDVYECDLFIYAGGESEEWADRILNAADSKGRRVISMLDCCEKAEEETEEGMWTPEFFGKDEHGEEETEYDEHVWTSLDNASAIVCAIRDTLCEMDQTNAEIYRKNAEDYLQKLSTLKESFQNVVDNAQRKTIVFGDRFPLLYFVKEFGLEYKAAYRGCAADSEAGAETVAYLIDYVSENEIPVVFRQDLSNGNIASVISEGTGAEVRVFYSCHNLSKEDFDNGETYLSLMEKNLVRLKEALN